MAESEQVAEGAKQEIWPEGAYPRVEYRRGGNDEWARYPWYDGAECVANLSEGFCPDSDYHEKPFALLRDEHGAYCLSRDGRHRTYWRLA